MYIIFRLTLICKYLGCGQALFGNNGTLESPNYPYNYPNNARCVWTITTDPDTRVVLTFSYFRLEYDYGCDDDSLVVSIT